MENIAIYIGNLREDSSYWKAEEQLKYTWVKTLLQHFKETKFVLISDLPLKATFEESKQIEKVALGKLPKTNLSLQRHFNHKLFNLLKESNCDLFLSLTGILPQKYKGRSCLLISDHDILQETTKRPSSFARYRDKKRLQSLPKASCILTLSKYTQSLLLSSLQLPEEKIKVIQPVTDARFTPLEWEERQEVKEKYSEGKEFIFFSGSLKEKEPLLLLLKAFTILKKKMNSGMMLVIEGEKEEAFKKFSELLRTYHFGKDVKVTGSISRKEKAALAGAAYAGVIPSSPPSFYSPVIDLIQCHTPVIVPQESIHEAVGEEMVLSFTPESYTDLGKQLCELYKNEEIRANLIRQEEIQTTQISIEGEMRHLLDIIRKISQE